MEAMRSIPDKYFQLAVCDPPYGIGHDGQPKKITAQMKHRRKYHESKGWDKTPPPKEYFTELERISLNQIIFGGNYFVPMLTKGTKGWIVWYKGQQGLTMSDCELAYTSFNCPTRVVIINRSELNRDGGTIHPTQKPLKLYKWILLNYAKPGDRIIDTHAGSASCLIACHDMGFEYTGFEIDTGYFEKASERLECVKRQVRIFD
jgi:site-specific DNA-methyltransferase (adenine-specific)